MKKTIFINNCALSGYASKPKARQWCKENPKKEYTEEDYISVYRFNGYWGPGYTRS